MDTLSVEIRTSVPWELIFADDIALMAETEEELQRKVINWQEALRKGIEVNTQKSKVLLTEKHGETEVKVVDTIGVELKQVKRFKYLGTEIATEGKATEPVKQRIKMAWTKWREITGVVCDRKMPKKLKCKLYKTVVRPVLMYGAECWAVGKKVEDLLSRTEMRMLRWILGTNRRDKIRNEETDTVDIIR